MFKADTDKLNDFIKLYLIFISIVHYLYIKNVFIWNNFTNKNKKIIKTEIIQCSKSIKRI